MSGTQRDIDPHGKPNWVGHPLLKYPMILLIASSIWSQFAFDDYSRIVAFAITLIPFCLVSIVAAILVLRGRLDPLHPPQFPMLNPIAGVVVGLAFFVLCAAALIGTFFPTEDRRLVLLLGAWSASGIFVLAIVLHLLSLSSAWPDAWRPPYDPRLRPRPPDDEQGTADSPGIES